MARRRKMTEEELIAAVDGQVASAIGGDDSGKLIRQREKAMEYYLGEPYGNEVEGSSQVRTREVMDTIEWIKPELMKTFSSGGETVRFEPQGPDDVAQAQQETDYINYVFHRKNRGFLLLYQWITDGLLQKNGIVKAWFDDSTVDVKEDYTGLTQMELEMLTGDPNVEITEYAEVDSGSPELGILYDVAIIRKGPPKGICIENIPPEEFLISKAAKSVYDSPFCAHRTMKTISDLYDMGYSKKDIEQIASGYVDGDQSREDEKRARHDFDDTYPEDDSEYPDRSMRRVWYTEAYIRTDFDGDNHAEIRKVCMVGKTLLANDEVDCMPFAGWTPIIISHKFHGLSMADLVMDLQLIQSQLLRNILNNQYLQNNGRYAILDGQVNMDDLMTSRAHGIVRQKIPGAVQRLDTPQLGPTAFSMLEYMDKLREKRTGVSERTQGIDHNQLGANQAASAVNQVMTAAQQRIELIARVFAETGLTDLFKLLHKLAIQNNTAPEMFRLRDTYVEVNPSEWKERYDTSVVVGLGNGSKESEMMQLGMIFQNQQQLAQNPAYSSIVGRTNVFNTMEDMVKIYNKASAGRYFTNPESPEAKKAREAQDQQQAQQAQMQQQMAQMQLQIEDRKVKVAELEAQIAQMKAQGELGLKGREVAVKEGKLQQDDMHHDDEVALQRAELEMEYDLELKQNRGVELG